jgi:hypothetical protein
VEGENNDGKVQKQPTKRKDGVGGVDITMSKQQEKRYINSSML